MPIGIPSSLQHIILDSSRVLTSFNAYRHSFLVATILKAERVERLQVSMPIGIPSSLQPGATGQVLAGLQFQCLSAFLPRCNREPAGLDG